MVNEGVSDVKSFRAVCTILSSDVAEARVMASAIWLTNPGAELVGQRST